MANLSTHVLEAMGFRRLSEGESLSAAFYSLYIYELQGIEIEEDESECVIRAQSAVCGIPYEIAIGTSVNTLTQSIIKDNLVEDETKWQKDQKCKPPFVLIHIGPTSEYAISGEFVKIEDSTVTTYKGFIPVRSEIQEMEKKVIPSLISALTCSLGQSRNHLKLRKIECHAFGITSSGMFLHDVIINFQASIYTSDRLKLSEIEEKVRRANILAASINPKISRLFSLALEEEDLLKRFLYFFLVIEQQTHLSFGAMDHEKYLSEIIQSPDRVQASSTIFFKKQREHWKTLKDRFIWCALSIWTHLDDSDIEVFEYLKKTRDKIAHGEILSPPDDAVREIEKLAIKLQTLC